MFRRVCGLFCVETAVDLAGTMAACMKRYDSIVYIGFNLQVKRAYYGMVHERARCTDASELIIM